MKWPVGEIKPQSIPSQQILKYFNVYCPKDPGFHYASCKLRHLRGILFHSALHNFLLNIYPHGNKQRKKPIGLCFLWWSFGVIQNGFVFYKMLGVIFFFFFSKTQLVAQNFEISALSVRVWDCIHWLLWAHSVFSRLQNNFLVKPK